MDIFNRKKVRALEAQLDEARAARDSMFGLALAMLDKENAIVVSGDSVTVDHALIEDGRRIVVLPSAKRVMVTGSFIKSKVTP